MLYSFAVKGWLIRRPFLNEALEFHFFVQFTTAVNFAVKPHCKSHPNVRARRETG